MPTIGLVALLLVGNLLFTALALRLGAHIVHAPRASFRRALAAVLTAFAVNTALLFALVAVQEAIGSDNPAALAGVALLCLVGQVLAAFLVIKVAFHTAFVRTLVIWAFGLTAGLAAAALMLGVIRPYVLEGFVVPTNSMAPAVVGWHAHGVCPHCQGVLIVPASPPGENGPPGIGGDGFGICTNCRRTGGSPAALSSVEVPDRILANKLLTARRWDMVVVRDPTGLTRQYVKRLVGLPGDTVVIKDGSVWINDVRAELPADLAGLRYSDAAQRPDLPSFGTAANPLRLTRGEYCVLADFSERSVDSRSWGPVPEANIEGVVSLCYWPVARWRLFR